MQPVALNCPKCGASLGAPFPNGERVCAYCNQRVGAMAPAIRFQVGGGEDPARMMARQEAASRALAGSREVIDRAYRGVESAKRTNAIVCVVLGVMFALFALPCFAGAVAAAFAGGLGEALGVGLFGLFWAALSALLLALGVGGLKKLGRNERLRAAGVRGKATVVSYTESSLRVDGETKFKLSLRIEIEGRAPWDVMVNEPVPNTGRIYTNALLPVLVNPADPRELMIDWKSTIL